MPDIIRLVKGDERPVITVTITDDETGSAVSLANATAQVKFRKKGATTTLSTITGPLISSGTTGKFSFLFNNGELTNVDAGAYEGEIVITFQGGQVHTAYDLLDFRVRENFA